MYLKAKASPNTGYLQGLKPHFATLIEEFNGSGEMSDIPKRYPNTNRSIQIKNVFLTN